MAIGEATNVTTGEVRLSYVHLFKPYAFQAGHEEKYSTPIQLLRQELTQLYRQLSRREPMAHGTE